MDNLTNISTIKNILNEHGFTFSKKLGQNFLINPSVCPKMAEMSDVDKNIGVIEIGPGIGVLSVELAKRAKKLVCIEIDDRLKPILEKTLAPYENTDVIFGDVMQLDLHKIIDDNFQGMDIVVCANLPYYITTPIIMKFLEERLPIKSITVMVQKEAAVRLCALPGSRDVGAVTISLRYYCDPKILFGVSRGSFMPAPDVDSSVIRLNILENPVIDVVDEKMFFKVVKSCFSTRRKTISNCLNSTFGISKDILGKILLSCDISPTARAEQLSMKEFGLLSDAFSKHMNNKK